LGERGLRRYGKGVKKEGESGLRGDGDKKMGREW
jgi:hypothetical protein